MEKIIEILIKNKWNKYEDTNTKIIEKNNSVKELPNDYLQFIEMGYAGEGYIGKNYLYLWKIEHLEQLNKDYNIQKYLGINCYGFGTDGGDKCYCFDNKNGKQIIKCNLGDLDYKDTKIMANTFYEFIVKLNNEMLE